MPEPADSGVAAVAVAPRDDGGGAGDPDGPTEGATPRRRERSTAWWAFEWLCVIALALVLALAVRTFVIQTFYIPSGSMEPTLNIGDRIFVFKLAYDFTNPAIGDVVVFKAPPSEHCGDPSVTDLVKRIVGLPGQTIWSQGNTIWLQNPGATRGYPLHQDWTHSDCSTRRSPARRSRPTTTS